MRARDKYGHSRNANPTDTLSDFVPCTTHARHTPSSFRTTRTVYIRCARLRAAVNVMLVSCTCFVRSEFVAPYDNRPSRPVEEIRANAFRVNHFPCVRRENRSKRVLYPSDNRRRIVRRSQSSTRNTVGRVARARRQVEGSV